MNVSSDVGSRVEPLFALNTGSAAVPRSGLSQLELASMVSIFNFSSEQLS